MSRGRATATPWYWSPSAITIQRHVDNGVNNQVCLKCVHFHSSPCQKIWSQSQHYLKMYKRLISDKELNISETCVLYLILISACTSMHLIRIVYMQGSFVTGYSVQQSQKFGYGHHCPSMLYLHAEFLFVKTVLPDKSSFKWLKPANPISLIWKNGLSPELDMIWLWLRICTEKVGGKQLNLAHKLKK